MKTLISATTALMLIGGGAAFAQETQPTDPAATNAPAAVPQVVDTIAFVKAVPSSNEFEIQSSQLALKNAKSDDVKQFANKMIEDHTKAGADFKAALSQVDKTASTSDETSKLLPKEKAMLDQLSAAQGDEFEAMYLEMQVGAHKEAVALFSNYAQSGDDPVMKEFAKKTLPTLQAHYDHVQQLAAAHKKNG